MSHKYYAIEDLLDYILAEIEYVYENYSVMKEWHNKQNTEDDTITPSSFAYGFILGAINGSDFNVDDVVNVVENVAPYKNTILRDMELREIPDWRGIK